MFEEQFPGSCAPRWETATDETPEGTLPFGIRFFRTPSQGAEVDELVYDEITQTALPRSAKHKSTQTRTSTGAGDRNAPDDDTDVG